MKLSPREREVAELVKQGKSSKVIAHQLDISEKTVERYRQIIRWKLEGGEKARPLTESEIDQWYASLEMIAGGVKRKQVRL